MTGGQNLPARPETLHPYFRHHQREMLSAGDDILTEFNPPEVVNIQDEIYSNLG